MVLMLARLKTLWNLQNLILDTLLKPRPITGFCESGLCCFGNGFGLKLTLCCKKTQRIAKERAKPDFRIPAFLPGRCRLFPPRDVPHRKQ